VEILVGVASSLGSTGDIVEIIDAFDVERNVIPAFHESEISPGIAYFRKLDDFTIIELEGIHRERVGKL
jgi:hypothetical protein